MTKERLEELIKQRAKIWYDGHFEIQLNPEEYTVTETFWLCTTALWYNPKDKTSEHDCFWELDVLREDVDRAKWEHDMYTERTERFEPPMWEDVDYYCFSFVQPNNDFVKFEVKKHEYIEISESEYEELFYKSGKEATKENYEKACEIVRDLFKGEK